MISVIDEKTKTKKSKYQNELEKHTEMSHDINKQQKIAFHLLKDLKKRNEIGGLQLTGLPMFLNRSEDLKKLNEHYKTKELMIVSERLKENLTSYKFKIEIEYDNKIIFDFKDYFNDMQWREYEVFIWGIIDSFNMYGFALVQTYYDDVGIPIPMVSIDISKLYTVIGLANNESGSIKDNFSTNNKNDDNDDSSKNNIDKIMSIIYGGGSLNNKLPPYFTISTFTNIIKKHVQDQEKQKEILEKLSKNNDNIFHHKNDCVYNNDLEDKKKDDSVQNKLMELQNPFDLYNSNETLVYFTQNKSQWPDEETGAPRSKVQLLLNQYIELQLKKAQNNEAEAELCNPTLMINKDDHSPISDIMGGLTQNPSMLAPAQINEFLEMGVPNSDVKKNTQEALDMMSTNAAYMLNMAAINGKQVIKDHYSTSSTNHQFRISCVSTSGQSPFVSIVSPSSDSNSSDIIYLTKNKHDKNNMIELKEKETITVTPRPVLLSKLTEYENNYKLDVCKLLNVPVASVYPELLQASRHSNEKLIDASEDAHDNSILSITSQIESIINNFCQRKFTRLLIALSLTIAKEAKENFIIITNNEESGESKLGYEINTEIIQKYFSKLKFKTTLGIKEFTISKKILKQMTQTAGLYDQNSFISDYNPYSIYSNVLNISKNNNNNKADNNNNKTKKSKSNSKNKRKKKDDSKNKETDSDTDSESEEESENENKNESKKKKKKEKTKDK